LLSERLPAADRVVCDDMANVQGSRSPQIYRSHDGEILVRDADGVWQWRSKKEIKTQEQYFIVVWLGTTGVLVFAALVLLFVLIGSRAARADEQLPFGITCEQVVRYAADLKIPNTWSGRAQARIIALTFGIYLTDAQLNAAARCIRGHQENQ
jgi:hypothetical protein